MIEVVFFVSYFSKVKYLIKVLVDYIFVKYVKKLFKIKLGFVIYDNFKIIIVDLFENIDNFNKVE